MPTKGLSTALLNGRHGHSVAGGIRSANLVRYAGPWRRKISANARMASLPRLLELFQEAIDGFGGDGFGLDSQVGRERGGSRRGVSEVVLPETEIDTRFAQMRCLRVAQRRHGGACVDATGPPGSAQGILHAMARHGGGGCGHSQTTPARRGKKPHRVAVGFPVLAEQCEGLLGQRHIAVLRPFALAYVDDRPGTITIGHLQVGAFLKP
jgi:hypothetical protein